VVPMGDDVHKRLKGVIAWQDWQPMALAAAAE
jgi:hypothetical protein